MSDEKFKIPQSEIDSLARMLLPKIQEYFSTEKGWREYEQWKQQEMTIAETKDQGKCSSIRTAFCYIQQFLEHIFTFF